MYWEFSPRGTQHITILVSREVRGCVWAGQGDVGLLGAEDVVTEGPGVVEAAEAGLLRPEVPHHSLQLPVLQLVLGLESRNRVLRFLTLTIDGVHFKSKIQGLRELRSESYCFFLLKYENYELFNPTGGSPDVVHLIK